MNLRGVNTNPGADPEDMVAIRVWFNERLILTGRKRERRLLSIEDLRKRIEDGTGPQRTGQFVAMLIEKLAPGKWRFVFVDKLFSEAPEWA